MMTGSPLAFFQMSNGRSLGLRRASLKLRP
jgi:hypothetical protein